MMEIALALSLQQDQRLAGDDQAVGNQNAGRNAQVLDGNVILPDNNDDDDDDEDDDDEDYDDFEQDEEVEEEDIDTAEDGMDTAEEGTIDEVVTFNGMYILFISFLSFLNSCYLSS